MRCDAGEEGTDSEGGVEDWSIKGLLEEGSIRGISVI